MGKQVLLSVPISLFSHSPLESFIFHNADGKQNSIYIYNHRLIKSFTLVKLSLPFYFRIQQNSLVVSVIHGFYISFDSILWIVFCYFIFFIFFSQNGQGIKPILISVIIVIALSAFYNKNTIRKVWGDEKSVVIDLKKII